MTSPGVLLRYTIAWFTCKLEKNKEHSAEKELEARGDPAQLELLILFLVTTHSGLESKVQYPLASSRVNVQISYCSRYLAESFANTVLCNISFC